MTAPQPTAAPGAPADGGTGGQAPTGTQPTTPPPPAAPAAAPAAPKTQTDLASLPADVQKVIADARAEAARYRTEGQTAKQSAAEAEKVKAAVLKAAGLNPDGTDTPKDPAALAAAVEQAQAAVWTTAVENVVLRSAGKAGADAEKLLDSRGFVDSLDPFVNDDPKTPEFKTKIAAHIAEFIDQQPQFKAQPTVPAGPSGAPLAGGPGGGAITEAQLKTMSPADVAKAYTEGRLKHLM